MNKIVRIFYVLCLYTIFSPVLLQTNDVPNLILLTKQLPRNQVLFNMTCVVKGSALKSAIAWTFPIQKLINNIESEIINGNILDTFGDNVNSLWVDHGWKVSSSTQFPLSAVTDQRWEKFEMNYLENDKVVNLTEGSKSISFSIAVKEEAELVIRDKKYKYTFRISTDSLIIDCVDGRFIDKSNVKKIRWQQKMWLHIKIFWNDTDITTQIAETAFSCKMKNFQPFKFQVSSKSALWKMHKYNFLSTRNVTKLQQLGSQMQLLPHQFLSLYVAVCAQCQIEIKALCDNGIENDKMINGNTETAYVWQEVQLHLELASTSNCGFYVNTKCKQQKGCDKFWAIDDLRITSNNEFRISSVEVNHNNLNKWACTSLHNQSLGIRNTWNTLSANHSNYENEIEKISNITCNSAFNERSYCDKQRICWFDNTNENVCHCTPGFMGHFCRNECNDGFWGVDCKHKCGMCKHGVCNKKSAECNGVCDEGYTGIKCDRNWPVLYNSPEIAEKGADYVKVRFINVTYAGVDPDFVTIQIREHNSNKWIDVSFFLFFANTYVDIKNLKASTFYNLRAVLCLKTRRECYTEENVPMVNFTTTCIGATEDDIDIKATNESAKIIWLQKSDSRSCSINTYKVELREHNDKNLKISEEIENLFPFKNYTLVIINTFLNETITKRFRTKSGIPKLKSVKRVKNDYDSITVEWTKDDFVGEITEYVIKYRHLKYKSCNEELRGKSEEIRLVPTDTDTYKIINLKSFSEYHIEVYASTDAGNGPEKSLTDVTLEDDLIEPKEFPKNTEFKETNFVLTLPNCFEFRGSVRYNFRYECLEKWCKGQVLFSFCRVTFPLTSQKLNCDLNKSLIPYTEYKAIVYAKREKSKKSIKYDQDISFKTSPGVPPKVEELVAYSKNESSISLRWKPPYPTHGILKNYHILIANENEHAIAPFECELWDEYHCAEISNIQSNTKYKLFVSAVNQGVEGLGENSSIFVATKEEPSEAPEIISITFLTNNQINISWKHPNVTNGCLSSFAIDVLVWKSDYISVRQGDQRHIEFDLKKYEYKKNYSEQITLNHSTDYQLDIFGRNKYRGKKNFTIFSTGPPKPEFVSMPYIDNCEHNFCIIYLPDGRNISTESYIYVIAINPRDASESLDLLAYVESKWKNIKHTLKQDIQLLKNVTFTKTNFNRHVNVTFKNELGTNMNSFVNMWKNSDYTIYAVLHNVYKNKHNCSKYNLKLDEMAKTTSASGAIYSLFILLAIPIVCIVLFLYRRRTTQQNNGFIKMIRKSVTEENTLIEMQMGTKHELHTKSQKQQKLPAYHKQSSDGLSNFSNEKDYSCLIQLRDFERYVKESLQDKDDNDLLSQQHQKLPKAEPNPWLYGTSPVNKKKNRNNNLAAFAHTRVILKKNDGDDSSDYINANYIDGYRIKRGYIATQVPKNSKLRDFWRMIWQEKSTTIIMVASLVEIDKGKCAKYWPDLNENYTFGDISITNTKVEISADYTYTTLTVAKCGVERKVNHLHFTAWPDHGVPLYPKSLIPFVKKILTLQDRNPKVVHCSAGVGRTGTIILCDMALRMAGRENAIDMFKLLKQMREQTPNVVDNSEQYKLAHLVVLECIFGINTSLMCDKHLNATVNDYLCKDEIKNQMAYLDEIAWQDEVITANWAVMTNEDKNRFPSIVPGAHGRVYLTRYPASDEHSDYINAVYVDGFRDPNRFIVTQQPLPNTVGDFWRMIVEKEVNVILSLNSLDTKNEKTCQFWPTEENETMQPVSFITVNYKNTEDVGELYQIINLSVVTTQTEPKHMNVVFVQMKNWEPTQLTPNSPDELLLLWEETYRIMKTHKPFVITCYDGACASGLYLALSFLIEKINLEQQYDVCLAVRYIRHNRPQFVVKQEQFEFLYKAALVYLSSFEEYSNFNLGQK